MQMVGGRAKKKLAWGWRRRKVESLGCGCGMGESFVQDGVTCRNGQKGSEPSVGCECGRRRDSSRGVGGVWVSVPG